jgi:hypothetical protein
MSYLDLDAFLAAKLPEVKRNEEKEAIQAVILGASAYADQVTGRAAGFFNVAPNDPSVKRFRGDGSKVLRIPRHVAGTATVENVPLADYYESDQSGWLYKNQSATNLDLDGFPVWTKNALYVVAARWGFAAIPADITEAVSQIVLRWWQTQKGTLNQITPGGFVIERDVPLSARSILETWVKGEFDL